MIGPDRSFARISVAKIVAFTVGIPFRCRGGDDPLLGRSNAAIEPIKSVEDTSEPRQRYRKRKIPAVPSGHYRDFRCRSA
jgi:hypothetical protein